MQKERLLKLAQFLRNVPHDHFDIGVITNGTPENLTKLAEQFNSGDWNAHKCGTAACAIGWLPAAFPDDFKWDDGEIVAAENRRDFSAAEEFFDIDVIQSAFLFEPFAYTHKGWWESKSSPVFVAERIETFVETNGDSIPKSFTNQCRNRGMIPRLCLTGTLNN